ncbi:hypothetical protein ABZS77_05815 [Micromonospora sp. NPDC005298]|uniref:hypothetical protein n=1 Tax=Micromonospora sp. NPDC005298 TaxID=3156873 RepID=UPI0033B65D71
MIYHVTYRNDERIGGPAGLFVTDGGPGNAILWDHRSREWAFDPGLVVRFVNDHRNVDRFDTVDRTTAERVAEVVTGGAVLPGEEEIRSMFPSGVDDGARPSSGQR